MIIGPDFVWLHFPKCAGTTIERALKAAFNGDQTVLFDNVRDFENVIWHHSLSERAAYDRHFSAEGKSVICALRRLPSWILSRTYFEKQRNPEFAFSKEMMLRGDVFETGGNKNHADRYAQKYSENVDHWIRVESLVEDTRRAFRPFLDLGKINLGAHLSVRVNRTTASYDRNVAMHFTPHDIAELYDACPVWKQLEAMVYGNIATERTG